MWINLDNLNCLRCMGSSCANLYEPRKGEAEVPTFVIRTYVIYLYVDKYRLMKDLYRSMAWSICRFVCDVSR